MTATSENQLPVLRPSAKTTISSGSHFSTQSEHLVRPLRFFHPTRAELTPQHSVPRVDAAASEKSRWSSRASRKNRFTSGIIHVRHNPVDEGLGPKAIIPVKQRIRHPKSRLKAHLTWDVSFWVAVIFVLGSTAWIVNGFYLFLPLLDIGGDHATAASWWAFAGGTLFEAGSYLMFVEALNTGHDELFGPALWGLVSHPIHSDERLVPDKSSSLHDGKDMDTNKFRWLGLGSWRDLGFLACSIQMFAATIFWVSTITGLPHVIPNLATSPSVPIADVFYWTPQVIGGTGFIVSSLLLMLEVQTAWWKPSLSSLGWHVAVWNLVGAIGFTLCGALGYAALSSTKVNYQSVLATFWGSWAFLIGSVIQQWETLWREDPESGRGPE